MVAWPTWEAQKQNNQLKWNPGKPIAQRQNLDKQIKYGSSKHACYNFIKFALYKWS